MDTNEIREYQTIAAYLLKKHFGLMLNDTNLHEDALYRNWWSLMCRCLKRLTNW